MSIISRTKFFLPYLVILALAAFLLMRVLIIFSKGNDISGVEQSVVYSTQVLLNNGKLYLSPGDVPFSATQYTPLYYYLCGLTAKITSTNSDNIQALYTIGRSWNLIFNLLTAFFVYKIGFSLLSLSRNKSYLLFFLSFAFALSHNFAVRSDSLQDLFGVISIYVFLRYLLKNDNTMQSNLLLILTVFVTALSVFSKQSGIQLIIMFTGFCFLQKDWKSVLKLIVSTVIIYGAFLYLFNAIYPAFFENVVGGISNGAAIDSLIYVFRKGLFVLIILPLIGITVYLALKFNSAFKGGLKERYMCVLTAGSLIFASATALKMGSTAQYYVLFINLSLLYIYYMLSMTDKKDQHAVMYNRLKVLFYSYLPFAILLCVAYNVKLILTFDHNPAIENQRFAAIKTAEFIKQDMAVNHSDGKFIFTNLTNDYTIPSRQRLNNIFYKNCVVPQLDIFETSKGKSSVLGYSRLENMISNGEVAYIIESDPIQRFVLLDKLPEIKRTKFKLIKNIDGYLIYKFSPNK